MIELDITQELDLTPAELLLAERVISYSGPRNVLCVLPISDMEMELLALKVGRALVEAGSDPSPSQNLALPFTEKECWYLRETIDIFARVGRQEVGEGLSLKRKVYQALLNFEYQRKTADLPLTELKLVKEDVGPGKERVKQRLEEMNSPQGEVPLGLSVRLGGGGDGEDHDAGEN